MIKFYTEDQFDQWAQDFQEETCYQINQNQLNSIKYWVKNSNKPLNELFKLSNYSVSAECYILNDKVIIKTSKQNIMLFLQEKLNNNPILNQYTVPTYVYCFSKYHDIHKEHIDFIKNLNRKVECYSDCLVLQPRCILLSNKEDYFQWYENNSDINDLVEKNKIDLVRVNAGYLNGEIKYFDW